MRAGGEGRGVGVRREGSISSREEVGSSRCPPPTARRPPPTAHRPPPTAYRLLAPSSRTFLGCEMAMSTSCVLRPVALPSRSAHLLIGLE